MKPVVTEQTSKRFKGTMLIGLLLCCIGVVMIVAFGSPGWGVLSVILGLLVYFAGRIGAWWNHG